MRGSTPALGEAFLRYGGHTSCVALQAADDFQPDLLLDAGTGLRDLDPLLGVPFDGTLVLTHLHWDHTHGLPFAGALLDPDSRLQIVVPTEPGQAPLDALRPGISPPSFPVPVDQLSPTWSFRRSETEMAITGWRVLTAPIRHKGGPTVGVRIERAGHSLVYMPDHDLGEPDPAASALARDADVLLHDAQYLASEIGTFRHYGHSTIERAIAFAADAGVRHLVLTHHAPGRTDDELDAIATDSAGPGLQVTVARQGALVTIL